MTEFRDPSSTHSYLVTCRSQQHLLRQASVLELSVQEKRDAVFRFLVPSQLGFGQRLMAHSLGAQLET